MANHDEEFLARLREAFRAEAEEHLQVITSLLLEMENQQAASPATVETIYREAHTLKGAARAVGLVPVEAICQRLERTFADLRSGQGFPSADAFDLMLRSLDEVRRLVEAPPDEAVADIGLIEKLSRLPDSGTLEGSGVVLPVEKQASPQPSRKVGSPQAQSPLPGTDGRADSVRVKAEVLKSVLLCAEELLPLGQELSDLHRRLEELEQLLAAEMTNAVQSAARLRAEAARRASHALGERMQALSGRLMEQTKEFLVVPAAAVMAPFPRMVRDIARAAGKEARFSVSGEELQIEREMLGDLREMLLHLIRNAVDHGLESREERTRAGKPRQGRIAVSLQPAGGGWMTISVEDDGRGVDLGKLREAAERMGVAPGSLPEGMGAGLMDLIFVSGVTTSRTVTEISGRGLGMAIVQDRVTRLGGTISVGSAPGKGTTFTVRLPLIRSSFRGVHVKTGGRDFIIPVRYVDRVLRLGPEDHISVEGRPMVFHGGAPVGLFGLSQLLGIDTAAGGTGRMRVALVVSGGEEQAALAVDSIESELEVMAKHPGQHVEQVREVEAVAVLGAGQVVPVLNVPKLLVLAQAAGRQNRTDKESSSSDEQMAAARILVADDSITSRMLLKNVLEGAGYIVRTAVDGQEAWTVLQEEAFNAVVTDLEMPRMDGFELTRRIRAEASFRELPVVLVTALGSREDRERGVEAGASAYIVKSSFDQSDLLGRLGRLLHGKRPRQ